MSESASSENSQPNFSLLSFLVRIHLYYAVFASVFLPSYVTTEFPVSRCTDYRHQIPYYHRCGNPARNNIDVISRAQQNQFYNGGKFADSIKDLGLGIKTETPGYYSYRIVQPMVPVQDLDRSMSPESNLPMRMAIAQCKIKDDSNSCSGLKNYLNVVWNYGSGTEALTLAVVCEMTQENPLPTTMPNLEDPSMICPSGSRNLAEN